MRNTFILGIILALMGICSCDCKCTCCVCEQPTGCIYTHQVGVGVFVSDTLDYKYEECPPTDYYGNQRAQQLNGGYGMECDGM